MKEDSRLNEETSCVSEKYDGNMHDPRSLLGRGEARVRRKSDDRGSITKIHSLYNDQIAPPRTDGAESVGGILSASLKPNRMILRQSCTV